VTALPCGARVQCDHTALCRAAAASSCCVTRRAYTSLVPNKVVLLPVEAAIKLSTRV
jgi:hypothetical protein